MCAASGDVPAREAADSCARSEPTLEALVAKMSSTSNYLRPEEPPSKVSHVEAAPGVVLTSCFLSVYLCTYAAAHPHFSHS